MARFIGGVDIGTGEKYDKGKAKSKGAENVMKKAKRKERLSKLKSRKTPF
jgi:hypothetical protein